MSEYNTIFIDRKGNVDYRFGTMVLPRGSIVIGMMTRGDEYSLGSHILMDTEEMVEAIEFLNKFDRIQPKIKITAEAVASAKSSSAAIMVHDETWVTGGFKPFTLFKNEWIAQNFPNAIGEGYWCAGFCTYGKNGVTLTLSLPEFMNRSQQWNFLEVFQELEGLVHRELPEELAYRFANPRLGLTYKDIEDQVQEQFKFSLQKLAGVGNRGEVERREGHFTIGLPEFTFNK